MRSSCSHCGQLLLILLPYINTIIIALPIPLSWRGVWGIFL